MKPTLKSVFKYLVFVSIAIGLLLYVYRNQDFSQILKDVRTADPFWVAMSVSIALLSHVSRGWRWCIALQPAGFRVNPFRAFLAVMVGYFANLFVPRMGEVARCGILKKTDKVPVTLSFGAVVAERALDLIMLVSFTLFTLLVEFDKLGSFLMQRLELGMGTITMASVGVLSGLVLIGIAFLIIVYKQRHRLRNLPGYAKVAEFIIGLKEGLLSITQLNRIQQVGYVFHTLFIWVMYYLMTYVLFFTQAETSALSMMTALTVFIMGGIGMVIPTPGGVGSYHLFVGVALMAYGLGETDSKAFAFLMHSTQTIAVLIAGGASLLIASFLQPKPDVSLAKNP